jgi:hypothetical protein
LWVPPFWEGTSRVAAADSIWLIKMGRQFLGPFSALLWYIVISHLVLPGRADYLLQLVIFVGTAAAIYLLLINGVYHL